MTKIIINIDVFPQLTNDIDARIHYGLNVLGMARKNRTKENYYF